MENNEMSLRKDNFLAYLALQGDIEAGGIIYKKYFGKFYSQAAKMVGNVEDAKDLAQEAFLKIFKNFRSFDTTQNFDKWAFTILYNLCRNFLRDRKVRSINIHLGNMDKLEQRIFDSPIERIDLEARIVKLHDCLSALPENQQVILNLRYFQELDYNQIASKLGIPVGTVRSRIHAGKAALREQYGQSLN